MAGDGGIEPPPSESKSDALPTKLIPIKSKTGCTFLVSLKVKVFLFAAGILILNDIAQLEYSSKEYCVRQVL